MPACGGMGLAVRRNSALGFALGVAVAGPVLGCSATLGATSNNVSNGSAGAGVLGTGGPTLNVQPGGGTTKAGGGAGARPSGCKSAAVTANTGQFCQGAPYQPGMQAANIESDAGCGTTLWGVARGFIGYNQVATFVDCGVNPGQLR